ncbi:VOC family protein [Nonomuraea endophytica]|uniref:VOC family protein n=1 Tax=Nonomuraea endophytica TaxID=714136 RepID=UPI001622D3EA|nr:VOC family protein [Nonomuraea endophytica]
MTGPALQLASCALAVHDVDEALGFYRDVLGFEVGDGVVLQGTRWVSVSPPTQPDLRLLLGTDLGAQDLMTSRLLSCLTFVTDDCDATFEHIEAAGAEVMQEPIDQPDGARDCAFLDPSGNMLRFTEPRPGSGSIGLIRRRYTTTGADHEVPSPRRARGADEGAGSSRRGRGGAR